MLKQMSNRVPYVVLREEGLEYNFYDLAYDAKDKVHNPQRFSDAQMAWRTLRDLLAYDCTGFPTNGWSPTRRFLQLKNVNDNKLKGGWRQ